MYYNNNVIMPTGFVRERMNAMNFNDLFSLFENRTHVIVFKSGHLLLDFYTDTPREYFIRGNAGDLFLLCDSNPAIKDVWLMHSESAIAIDV